jgi:alkylation response protein AidB-like acyl-CoA dehydrogenase
MTSSDEDERLQEEVRASVAGLCARFPAGYWAERDRTGTYPEEFVQAMTAAGWLGMLVPAEYGGGGASLRSACTVLEQIHLSGGTAAACHAQMYVMGALVRHGSPEQKARFLPPIAAGTARLQSMAVTEPEAGSDTTAITTRAEPARGGYLISGRKVFISRTEHTDLMLVLARTAPRQDARRRTEGLSLFIMDVHESASHLDIRPIRTMVNHHTTEVVFDHAYVPAENVIGEPGLGFRYILSGLNAERILIASEAVGDGRFFVERAAAYAGDRNVFGRTLGANQGIQFPLAAAHIRVCAAALMRDSAARRFDRDLACGAEANMAKWLASEAAWEAANIAMTTFGGYGMASEYGIERKFREARLHIVAPVSNNLVLSHVGTHALGLPRSF